MFKKNIEEEVDFCEAYKSQILNNDKEEKSSPLVSILIILFSLAIIIAFSIFGYNYMINNNGKALTQPTAGKTFVDEALKVTEDEAPVPMKSESKTEVAKKMEVKDDEVKKAEIKKAETQKVTIKTFEELPKSKSLDINDLADKVKIDMSESETIENPTISSSTESNKNKYVEDLAKEKITTPTLIDSSQSKYIKDLEILTAEIDKERK